MTLDRLRRYTHQPLLTGWRGPQGTYLPNAKGHLAWDQGGVSFRVEYSLTLGQDWASYPIEGKAIYLQWYWWARVAQFWVNGVLVLEGDLFDQRGRVLLTDFAKPGQEFLLTAYLESPNHDQGALYNIELQLEHPNPRCDPGYFADEWEGIQQLNLPDAEPLLVEAWTCLKFMPEHSLSQMETSFQTARNILKPLGSLIKKQQVNLVGHSHIDMAWLWPHAETLTVTERTFRSVLNLQSDYPELNFVQSTAYLYHWLEHHRPELFEKIKSQVALGRWEIVGGMWVEPDLNLPDGESIIRQIYYGKQYFKRAFNLDIQVGWNPDSFGYMAQLPQIYLKSGIPYFVTQKLLWNDSTTFPHQTFWWEALDGSRILTYFAPPLGESIPPVKVMKHLGQQAQILWLYGVGDHGGGPTADMLEQQRRWRQSDFSPTFHYTSTAEFLKNISTTDLPIWRGELYLEFHRGCYTSHADQKYYNRRAEVLLTNVEKVLFLAYSWGQPIDSESLEIAWKRMLFNQFHDILPGTAIPEVFADANREWNTVFEIGEAILAQVWASFLIPNPNIWSVVNLLNWPRSAIIALRVESGFYQLLDSQGQSIPLQYIDEHIALARVELPAFSCAHYQLVPVPQSPPTTTASPYLLENAYLRITLDPETGQLTSFWDKRQAREYLAGPANQWQAFRDQGQYWDAWNIDPAYRACPLPAPELLSLTSTESGPLRFGVRTCHQLGDSLITQDLTLAGDTLTFTTLVDWQASQVLLKVNFPLALQSEQFWCEVPMGALARPTHRQTAQAAAQWEVPALRWAAYEAEGVGIALLNDCKYGYACRDNELSLTLLRAPLWPDPTSDRGPHRFTYQLYAYSGSWQTAQVVQRGHELNNPPLLLSGCLKAMVPQLELDPALVLAALKPTGDPHTWIVRFYEPTGQPTTAQLTFSLAIEALEEVNLMEEPIQSLDFHQSTVRLSVAPWEIKTLRVRFK